MIATPKLQLPYILASQAQKHVTHNEALRALDALVQLAVLDKDLATPPATPGDGDRYIVGPSATGVWSGQTGKIVAFQDGAWMFYTPITGWSAWVADESRFYSFTGTIWADVAASQLNPAPLVGVNATANAGNRLSVASPASLFNHEGAGHQLKVNKAAAAHTASLLYQNGFSGRAEIGLTGDDDLHLKVSADGSTWREAMRIDRTTGVAAFPFTPGSANQNLLINGDYLINQRAFSGGALAAGIYGHDRWKAHSAGANYTVSFVTVTLTSGAIVQIVEPALWGYGPLAGQRVTVSLADPTADITVVVASATGTITAGSGRRSVTLTLGVGDTGNLEVRLSKATAGTVSFSRVKLELGDTATPWVARPITTERALAARYFVSGAASGYILGLGDTGNAWLAQFFQFPGEMRALPTFTFTNPHNSDASLAVLVAGSFRSGTTIAAANSTKGFNAYVTVSSGSIAAGTPYVAQGNYAASAEL